MAHAISDTTETWRPGVSRHEKGQATSGHRKRQASLLHLGTGIWCPCSKNEPKWEYDKLYGFENCPHSSRAQPWRILWACN